MAKVYLSIGSNIDREQHIRGCLDALAQRFGPLDISSVFESAAVGFSGAPFYNLVVGIETELDPAALNQHQIQSPAQALLLMVLIAEPESGRMEARASELPERQRCVESYFSWNSFHEPTSVTRLLYMIFQFD